jgi:syntaxin 5
VAPPILATAISRVSTPPIIPQQPQPQPQQSASPRMRQPTCTQDPYFAMKPNVLQVDTDAPVSKKYDDHVAIELQDQQQQSLLYQEQQEPLLGSLRNRSTALNTLESTINELGTIYQQLAHMVSQQGEVVQRIDMNIEDMSFNVQRGQGELARYLRRVSSGRMFIAKIFIALIIFIILMKFIFW